MRVQTESLRKEQDTTLWTAKMTAAVSAVGSAVYAASEVEPSAAAQLLLMMGPLIAVIVWLQKDAHRTGVGAIQDWGLFLFLFWPAVIPWYAWKTRGVRGWRLAAGLIGLILSSYIAWIIVAWSIHAVRLIAWHFQAGE